MTTFSTKDIQIGDFITFKSPLGYYDMCVSHIHDGIVYGSDVEENPIACFSTEVVENLGQ